MEGTHMELDGRRSIQMSGLMLERKDQMARCVRGANGERHFEFWVAGAERAIRFDADKYMAALENLYDNAQDEDVPEFGAAPPRKDQT